MRYRRDFGRFSKCLRVSDEAAIIMVREDDLRTERPFVRELERLAKVQRNQPKVIRYLKVFRVDNEKEKGRRLSVLTKHYNSMITTLKQLKNIEFSAPQG
jgi:hypothetical protein